jgi:hypothetical protein
MMNEVDNVDVEVEVGAMMNGGDDDDEPSQSSRNTLGHGNHRSKSQ